VADSLRAGMADDLPPGPVLAGLTADRHAAGLGQLTDGELIGVLRAARRLASWSASLELAAVGDLMRRRIDQETAGQKGMAEHADAEIAAALTLTGRAAGQLLDLAMVLDRLPLTARAPVASLLPSSDTPDRGDIPDRPPLAGMVNLTVPLGTWLGVSQSPGEVPGFGPLDADDSRSLSQAMAAHPRTRWCLTITDENGHPIAHGCARRRRGPPPSGDPVLPMEDRARPRGSRAPPAEGGEPPTGDPEPPTGDPEPPAGDRAPTASAAGGSRRAAGPAGAAGVAAWVAGLELEWLETGVCAHRRESAGYRPPGSLQHLIRVRQAACAFPGCGRPARRCDLDHTVPYEAGGRTCECNLAPLCRRHHQCKQAHGWTLDQSRPGIMTWTTPSGRSYTTYTITYPD
jgi:hypothetical protein